MTIDRETGLAFWAEPYLEGWRIMVWSPLHRLTAKSHSGSILSGRLAKLIAASFFAMILSICQRSPAQQATPTTQPGGGIPTLDDLFAMLDKNHDGVISKDEATGVYARRFPRWDVRGRGYVTRQDVHDFRVSHGIDDNGQRIAPGGRAAATPVILKEPADWRFETFPMPPGFAPDVKLKGSEEARFSPGMYDTTSPYYFTYAIAITAEGPLSWGPAELKDFLEEYFRGLSTGRAKRTGAQPDVSQMIATVAPRAGAEGTNRLSAQMVFIDSFTDGRKVTLNVETQLIDRPEAKQSVIIFLISPSATDSPAWKDLREVGKKAASGLR